MAFTLLREKYIFIDVGSAGCVMGLGIGLIAGSGWPQPTVPRHRLTDTYLPLASQ